MRQAIVTKFLGPTNTRGSRVKATAQAGSITLELDYARSREDNHRMAARVLANKLDWSGVWDGGWLPDGQGVFVQEDGEGVVVPKKA